MGILDAKQNKTYIFFIEDDKCNREILFTKTCKSPDRTKEYKETMKRLSDANVHTAGFELKDSTFKLAYKIVDKLIPKDTETTKWRKYDKDSLINLINGMIVKNETNLYNVEHKDILGFE